MNKKLSAIAKIAILLFSITTLFSACTEEKIYEDNRTQFYQKLISIKANEWKWNSSLSRYEATRNLDGFKDSEYDYAMIAVSTFWNEGNIELQTSLPYVRSWIDNNSNKSFTETVSYELVSGSRTILFFIQNSELREKPDSKLDYEFKFSAIDKY